MISKWAPVDEEEEEPEIKLMPMWITLKNVPHRMYSWEGPGFISSAVGKPVKASPRNRVMLKFCVGKGICECGYDQGVTQNSPVSIKIQY